MQTLITHVLNAIMLVCTSYLLRFHLMSLIELYQLISCPSISVWILNCRANHEIATILHCQLLSALYIFSLRHFNIVWAKQFGTLNNRNYRIQMLVIV